MAEEKDIESFSDEEIQNMTPPEISEESEPSQQKAPEQNTQEQENTQNTPSKNNEEEEQEQEDIDYEAFYKTMMSPIKANGKTFQPRNAGEAIRLMQMGANYTQKMQSLAPHRKTIQMLQKAQLLDPDKLNFLIDVAQGKPQAISKLLRDTNVDPLDLDTREDARYVPGNHMVSDAEGQLQSVLDDLSSTPEGQATLEIAKNWDQASLQEIGKDPSILSTLHEQRTNGVFNLITQEMEHQRMLGNIPEGTPFLKAYKVVGDYCLQQFRQKQAQQKAGLPQGTLNQRGDPRSAQVRRAAPSGRSKKTNQTFVDPFSLSDEEFEKQFANYA